MVLSGPSISAVCSPALSACEVLQYQHFLFFEILLDIKKENQVR
jgi:hypothetical protein